MKTPKLIINNCPHKGSGLFAAVPLPKGEVFASFDGKFIRWSKSVGDIPNTAPDYLRDHCIQVGPGLSRDTSGWARYANHSCRPNCGIHGLYDLVTMRDIGAGEELTWDYAMTEDNDWSILGCKCGSKRCRKNILGYRFLSDELKAEYWEYTSDWLKGIRTGESDALMGELIGTGLLLKIG